MVARYHLDTDFLVLATTHRKGREYARLLELLRSRAFIEMSAIAWYEFVRGPRTPEAIAAARSVFGPDGIVPFDETAAERAADLFRRAGATRRRGADMAIAAHAIGRRATLLTNNAQDYPDLPELKIETA